MGDFPLNIDPKPINGGVLVRIIGGSNKSAGGIILPPTTQGRPIQGRVEEISRGYHDGGVFRGHEVEVGDIVMFSSKNSIADRSFRFLRPEDFTYPEGTGDKDEKAEGQQEWASVRSRQSGTFDAIERQKEIDKLKYELELLKNKEGEIIIGGQ